MESCQASNRPKHAVDSAWCVAIATEYTAAAPHLNLAMSTAASASDMVDIIDQDCHQAMRPTDVQLAKWRQTQTCESLARGPCQKAPSANDSIMTDDQALATSNLRKGDAADPVCEGLVTCQDSFVPNEGSRGEDGYRSVRPQQCEARQEACVGALAREEPDVILLTASPWVEVQVLHTSVSQLNVGKDELGAAPQCPHACFAKPDHEAETVWANLDEIVLTKTETKGRG